MIPVFSYSQSKSTPLLPTRAGSKDLQAANNIVLPSREGKVFYELVDSSFKKNKTDVYNSAKLWFAEIFKDSKYVLELQDKDLGELMGKGNFPYSAVYNGVTLSSDCFFDIKVSCRENKYRLQIYNISIRLRGSESGTSIDGLNSTKEPLMQAHIRAIDNRVTEIIKSSKTAIAQKTDTF